MQQANIQLQPTQTFKKAHYTVPKIEDSMVTRIRKAYESGEDKQIMNLYAPNVEIYPPNMKTMVGMKGVEEYLSHRKAMMEKGMSKVIDHIDERLYEDGTGYVKFHFRYVKEGQLKKEGRVALFLKKNNAGQWQIEYDMYNYV